MLRDGGAVAAQQDALKQLPDLVAVEHNGLLLQILGANLGKYSPVLPAQQPHEEELGACGGLANGFGLPEFFGFNMEDVIEVSLLGDGFGIAAAVLVDQTHLPVMRMTRARRIEPECQKFGKALHRRIRMVLVIDGVASVAPGLGPILVRQLLIARGGGSFVRTFVRFFCLGGSDGTEFDSGCCRGEYCCFSYQDNRGA